MEEQERERLIKKFEQEQARCEIDPQAFYKPEAAMRHYRGALAILYSDRISSNGNQLRQETENLRQR